MIITLYHINFFGVFPTLEFFVMQDRIKFFRLYQQFL